MKPQTNKTAPKTTTPKEEKADGPNKSYRLGNINLAEWHKMNSEGVEFENFTINRNYTDKDNVWHNTQSLGFNDLLKLRNLLDVVILEKTTNAIVRRGKDYDDEEEDVYPEDAKVYSKA